MLKARTVTTAIRTPKDEAGATRYGFFPLWMSTLFQWIPLHAL
jgi:hypothetical protein